MTDDCAANLASESRPEPPLAQPGDIDEQHQGCYGDHNGQGLALIQLEKVVAARYNQSPHVGGLTDDFMEKTDLVL